MASLKDDGLTPAQQYREALKNMSGIHIVRGTHHRRCIATATTTTTTTTAAAAIFS